MDAYSGLLKLCLQGTKRRRSSTHGVRGMQRLSTGLGGSRGPRNRGAQIGQLRVTFYGAAMRDVGTQKQCRKVSVRTGGNGLGQDVFAPREWNSLATALDLSPRESGVVRALFDGASEKRIAEQLGISPHTVHTYLWRIYRKLHVQSRQELLVRVFAEFRALS